MFLSLCGLHKLRVAKKCQGAMQRCQKKWVSVLMWVPESFPMLLLKCKKACPCRSGHGLAFCSKCSAMFYCACARNKTAKLFPTQIGNVVVGEKEGTINKERK